MKKHMKKTNDFRPKIAFEIEQEDFIIKTVQSPQELEQILNLRNKVFWEERLKIIQHPFDDLGEMDFDADHVILIDKKNNQVVGGYRLLCTKFCQESQFYSSLFFEIDEFLKLDGIKVELSRACIHPDYRNGVSIALIWKGLGKYIHLTNSSYVWGFGSLDNTDKNMACKFWQHLKDKELWSNEYVFKEKDLDPNEGFFISEEELNKTMSEWENCPLLELPPLLRSYLKAGSKTMALPQIDKKLNTTDFITVLDLSKISPRYYKQLGLDEYAHDSANN